ncbi:hypothetical protein OIU84_006555 [Salix udensis]|uniref:Uncharacterized protein n=1 Tax=Salix udensis TaxID=889485 RepID=A0AAD6P2I4_9ROSI|nr:hypothetical protein OIU84_006555 [Salix udensis]
MSLEYAFPVQNKDGWKALESSDLSVSRMSNQARLESKKSNGEYRQNGLIHRRRYGVGFTFSPKGERLSPTPPSPFETRMHGFFSCEDCESVSVLFLREKAILSSLFVFLELEIS